MPRDVQIAGAAGAAPQSYEVPNATEIIPRAINATFNGAAAASAFKPTVEIISDGGVVVARVPCNTTVAAGGSAECTFAPFLRDEPTSSTPGATGTYLDTVLATGPRAFWRFNESAGAIAADSTGNGWDLTVHAVGPLGLGNWAWAQAVGPPGDQTVTTQGGGPWAQHVTFPAKSDNFAAGVWVRIDSQFLSEPQIMGQGDPSGNIPGGGWRIFGDSPTGLINVGWSDGAVAHGIVADAAFTVGTWYFIGTQRVAGTFQLWINGVQQTATSNAAILGAVGVIFAYGNAGAFYLRGGLSWSFVWDRPLTQAEWLTLAAAGGNLPEGWALQSLGNGTAAYEPLLSPGVTAGYRLTADGSGGTYWAP